MSYTEKEVQAIIKEIGDSFNLYKGQTQTRFDSYDRELSEARKALDAIETAVARSQFSGGGGAVPGSGLTTFGAQAKEHAERFYGWMRGGSGADELRNLEIQAGLSTVSDPDGGYLVPEEMDKTMERLAMDSVAMRRLARIVIASGDYKKPISAGGATAGWVGEMETRTDTDSPELKLFSPPWNELFALPEVTQTLLDMSDFDVAGWLSDELQIAEAEMEGAGFISGNGVKQPKGILSYETVANANWVWGKIGYIACGHASLLNNADKLMTLQHSLKPVYRRNGTFLMNDNTMETVRKFKDGDGNYIWRPGLAENAPDMLLGKPVEIDDNMPDIGAGAYPIAFGDFKRAYCIGDHKVGRRILRDPYTKKGWVKFFLTKRVFGGCQNHQAVKLLKIATA